MKKNFLLAMVVMLMTAVSSFAQKEYNMVITLSNGTTVTLGHNDIKEITFNDGEVAISGNMVNTIDSLAQVTRDLNCGILDNMAHNVDQDNRIEKLANATADGFVKMGTTIDTQLNNMAEVIDEKFAAQDEVNNTLFNSLETIVDYMIKLHPEMAESKEYKAAKAAVAAARKK